MSDNESFRSQTDTEQSTDNEDVAEQSSVVQPPDCIVCKMRAGFLKLSFIMRACSLLRRNMRAKLCTLIVTRAVFPEYTIQII